MSDSASHLARDLFDRGTWREVRRVGDILRTETVGGGLRLEAALVALICANSPWSPIYQHLSAWRIGPAELHLDLTLAQWAAEPGRDGTQPMFEPIRQSRGAFTAVQARTWPHRHGEGQRNPGHRGVHTRLVHQHPGGQSQRQQHPSPGPDTTLHQQGERAQRHQRESQRQQLQGLGAGGCLLAAGVPVAGGLGAVVQDPVTIGVVLGMVVGNVPVSWRRPGSCNGSPGKLGRVELVGCGRRLAAGRHRLTVSLLIGELAFSPGSPQDTPTPDSASSSGPCCPRWRRRSSCGSAIVATGSCAPRTSATVTTTAFPMSTS